MWQTLPWFTRSWDKKDALVSHLAPQKQTYAIKKNSIPLFFLFFFCYYFSHGRVLEELSLLKTQKIGEKITIMLEPLGYFRNCWIPEIFERCCLPGIFFRIQTFEQRMTPSGSQLKDISALKRPNRVCPLSFIFIIKRNCLEKSQIKWF